MSQTPRLEQVLDKALEEHDARFYTAVPGKITKYDRETQLASVEVQIVNSYDTPDGTPEYAWPIINSVPVMWPGSGGYRMTFPLEAGDKVLLIISSFPLHKWLTTGKRVANAEHPFNKNNMAGAFAIPGLIPALKQKHAEAHATKVVVQAPGGLLLGSNTGTQPVVKASTFITRFNAFLTALETEINLVAPGAGTAIKNAWVATGISSTLVEVV